MLNECSSINQKTRNSSLLNWLYAIKTVFKTIQENIFSTFLATLMKGRFISHNEIYLMRILHLQVIPTPNCVHRMPCQTFNMKIKSFYCKYRNISKRCFLIIYYFLEKYEVKSDVCVYFLQELDCILQSTCSISNSKASGLRKPLPQI